MFIEIQACVQHRPEHHALLEGRTCKQLTICPILDTSFMSSYMSTMLLIELNDIWIKRADRAQLN